MTNSAFRGPVGTVVVTLAIAGGVLSAQETSPAPSAAQARLGGIWKFNKDLSTDTSTLEPPAGSSDSGRSSGDSGGGAVRGSGRGAGRGNFRGGGSADPEQMLQFRALTREEAEAPDRLTIVVSPSVVEFTDDQGVVNKFTTNGKKEQIALGAMKVDATSKWDQDVLTIELAAGQAKLTEMYQVTVEGHALVETMKLQNGSGTAPGALPVKRIFDRVD